MLRSQVVFHIPKKESSDGEGIEHQDIEKLVDTQMTEGQMNDGSVVLDDEVMED